MSDRYPPRWAELLLERVLPARDREAVTGDLREEYAEFVRPQLGRLRAGLWYFRQMSSFATRSFGEGGTMGKALLFSSVLTASCGCWLALMEVLLRHPGFVSRAAVASVIAAAGLATLLVRVLHLGVRIERWLWAAAAALIGLGVVSFLRNARATHFEGFVFIISIILVLQGLLMLGTLGRSGDRGHKIAGAAS
jgi:hypothetical protein